MISVINEGMENTNHNAQFGQPAVIIPEKVKYCLYARKSTESDEKQALSIDSQIKEMLAIAERDELQIMDIRREAHSAKDSGQRPVFKELLEDIRRGRFNGIITWAPDRLSRNAGDLGSLVDLMDQKLLFEIRTYGQQFRNSPNEKFLLMILCSQAKLENDNKSINVKRGLKTRVEMGLWPSPAPIGYLNSTNVHEKGVVYIDPVRGPIIKQMFEKVAHENWSGKKIYQWFNDIKFTTRKGKSTTLSNIYLLLKNPFFYGVFEYPRNSGKWYQGKHKPLISKELFDLVQERVNLPFVRANKKEFAFTKLMKCGLCGSGITAEEKHKNLKNGETRYYTYYFCTQFYDKNCKCGYINESELIKQIEILIESINIDELTINDHIKTEVGRIKKFQKIVLNSEEDIKIKEIDIRNYARYILRESPNAEKRQLLNCFKSQIFLKDKAIYLKK